ncbi:ComEC/Rec2 family competence protein [Demequina globuliformis]|uniref:ComEC/Rec2 family competence protein n=1 Tax=Demequina globuliformis TaxID=676202 RepID=UPI000784FE27|nr:ComEC/Rec2 family competence protein [Demequina globuliformis]
MTRVHDARLVPAAGAAWAAVLAVAWHGVDPGTVAAGAWGLWVVAAGVVALAVRASTRRDAHARVVAVVACLGVAAAAASSAAFAAHLWERAAADGGFESAIAADEIDVRVVARERGNEYASARGRACMVPVTMTAWAPPVDGGGPGPPGELGASRVISNVDAGRWLPLRGPATVSLPECPRAGDTLELRADLVADGNGALAWDATVLAVQHGTGPVHEARRAFIDASAAVPDESRGLLRGMITGDTSSMSESQVADMRVAGIAHVTAVSGAHFAMVSLGVMALVRLMKWPRWGQAAAVSIAAAAFALLVGPQPSVVRATGFALIVAVAVAWGRRARALPALAVTILVVAHGAPAVVGEIGFAMSVTAVLAIVLVAPAIARRLSAAVTPRLASALSIPVAAQLALVPFLIFLQPGIGPYAVLANVAAAPFLAPVMALGLAAVLVAPWWAVGGTALAHLAAVPTTAMARISAGVADLPGAWLPWPSGPTGVLLGMGLGLAGLVATATHMVLVRAVAIVVMIAICAGVWGARTGLTRAAASDWDVVACDVGQGDMMLVRTGDRSAVVIDTGPDDVAAIACLDRYGVTTVPLLILTHPDLDHDGAAVAIATHVDVERAWIARAGEGGDAARGLRAAGIALEVPADASVQRLGPVTLEVLPGSQDGDPAPEGDNDGSITMLVSGARTSVLALGDLEPAGQGRLVATMRAAGQRVFTVDVVKVAHHGSRHQDADLAALIQARWAVFSAGRDNDYGHPASDAIEMYSGAGAHPLVTAECGDIAFAVNGPATGHECHSDVAR